MTFAGRLRDALRQRDMTQRALATALGMKTATAVSTWASGRRMPSRDNLLAMADALDVEPEWLAGEVPSVDRDGDGDAFIGHLEIAARDAFGPNADQVIAAVDHLLAAYQQAVRVGLDLTASTEFADFSLQMKSPAALARERGNPARDLERELESEARRLEGQRAAGDEVRQAQPRRGQAS